MKSLVYLSKVAAVLILAANLLSADTKDEEKWGKVSQKEWELEAPAAYPEANAVVIFDIGELEIPQPYDDNMIRFERHRRIKIFNKAGADEAARIEIRVVEGDRIKGLKAQTISKEGQKIEVSGKSVFEKKLGNGDKIVTFTFPAITDGCIVEYEYTMMSEAFGFPRPWYFQGGLYTLKSRFTLMLYPGFTYSTVFANVAFEWREPVVEEESYGDMKIKHFTWEIRRLLPVEDDEYMVASESYRASATCQLTSYNDLDNKVNFIEDWKSLGDKVLKVFDEFAVKSPAITSMATSLVSPSDTVEAKMKKIYDYICNEILTKDEESWVEFSQKNAGKVLENKFGTSAEKNALLIMMLRAVGVEALPLLMGTRDYSVFSQEICHISQFNHLICYATTSGSKYLLDTQERNVPFPFLPPFDLVLGGLILKENASTPIKFDQPKRRNALETSSQMSVHKDGSVSCSTHVNISGFSIYGKRELLAERPSDEIIRRDLLKGRDYEFELGKYGFAEFPDQDSATIDFVMTIPHLSEITEGQLLLTPMIYWAKRNPFQKEKRICPIDFNYPSSFTDVIDVTFDPGVIAAAPLQNVREAMNALTFTRTTIAAGNAMKIMSQLVIGRAIYGADEYQKVRSIFERITQASAEPVTATM